MVTTSWEVSGQQTQHYPATSDSCQSRQPAFTYLTAFIRRFLRERSQYRGYTAYSQDTMSPACLEQPCNTVVPGSQPQSSRSVASAPLSADESTATTPTMSRVGSYQGLVRDCSSDAVESAALVRWLDETPADEPWTVYRVSPGRGTEEGYGICLCGEEP